MRKRNWSFWHNTSPADEAPSHVPAALRALPRVADPCARWMLAQMAFGNVQLCACGSVHVTIAGYTLRLPADALAPLRDLLAEAVARLEAAGGPPRSPPADAGYEH